VRGIDTFGIKDSPTQLRLRGEYSGRRQTERINPCNVGEQVANGSFIDPFGERRQARLRERERRGFKIFFGFCRSPQRRHFRRQDQLTERSPTLTRPLSPARSGGEGVRRTGEGVDGVGWVSSIPRTSQ
jgi:hypothetical protein